MNKIVQLSPSSRVSPHRACRQLGKGGRWALAAFSTLLQLQRQHAFDQACCHRKPRLNSLLKRSRRPKAPKYTHFAGSVFTSNVSKLSFFVQKEMSASKSRWKQASLDPELVQSLRSPCGSKTNFFATPESNSLYPTGASLRGRTVALTILAICKRSWRMACISWRLYLSTGVWPV